MRAAGSIAVVIPTLDEAAWVAGTIASARGREHLPTVGPDSDPAPTAPVRIDPVSCLQASEAPAGRSDVDVLVIDGGSADDTLAEASRAGARVIECAPGRGAQLDLGWRHSEAEIVVFLHADTRLPPRWDRAVRDALEDERVAGGAFRFGFDEDGPLWRVLEWGVALRVALLRLPYGDQAIFVRRSVLESAGGVPHVAILEDLDVVRMIKRAGRLRVLPERVRTSTRRHRRGLTATVLRHALAFAGFFLGVDRGWIARRVRG